MCTASVLELDDHGAAGADPGFLKGGGGVHLRSTSKKGGVQEGVQLWAQC